MDIELESIKKGMPGISAVEGAELLENCIVMLHRGRHITPTTLKMDGLVKEDVGLFWIDTFTEQLDRTYADPISATERAAICVSVLLAKEITEYTVIMRSRRGTGFDYYLGKENDSSFQPQARLEISGIEKESPTNSLISRFRRKCEQVTPSDNTNLPAYISIIEFSNPKGLFSKKEAI